MISPPGAIGMFAMPHSDQQSTPPAGYAWVAAPWGNARFGSGGKKGGRYFNWRIPFLSSIRLAVYATAAGAARPPPVARAYFASGTGVCRDRRGDWAFPSWGWAGATAASGAAACDAEPACSGYGPTRCGSCSRGRWSHPDAA